MTSNLMNVVASSVAIARHAGKAIRTIMQSGNLAVIDKAEKGEKFDPQTEADRTAQNIIIGSLSKQFPGMCIIGEEEGCDSIKDELVVKDMDAEVLKQKCPEQYKDISIDDLIVWVDPLDGTREFTEGHKEHVTVLIGISAFGKAIAGVIHQPFFQSEGRTMWGVIGLNVFGIVPQTPPDVPIIITTKSHGTQLVSETIAALQSDPTKVIKTGGCGFKVLQVVEGVADAYVFATPGTKKWDSCAPEAILKAAGGNLTDILNENIDYSQTAPKYFMNWTGLLATRNNHEKFATKIPDSIKQNLKETFESKM